MTPRDESMVRKIQIASVAPEAASAMTSRARRCRKLPSAARIAAVIKGRTTGRGARCMGSAPHHVYLVRIGGSGVAMNLHSDGQQKGHYSRLDHDIGQHEG